MHRVFVFWSEHGSSKKSINLNIPSNVTAFIIYFLEHGWHPNTGTKPFEIENAMEYLDLIPFKHEG